VAAVFGDEYTAIFDDIKETLQDLKPDIRQVTMGESGNKFQIQRLPCAIINPGNAPFNQSDTAGWASVDSFAVEINGAVWLLITDSEPDDWFEDIVPLLGSIVDAILVDRTLGGTADDCVITLYAPGELSVRNALYYGGIVGFKATIDYTP
jgi:hypothetical protein